MLLMSADAGCGATPLFVSVCIAFHWVMNKPTPTPLFDFLGKKAFLLAVYGALNTVVQLATTYAA